MTMDDKMNPSLRKVLEEMYSAAPPVPVTPVYDEQDITVDVNRIQLYCRLTWAMFDKHDTESTWAAPLMGYADEAQAMAYRFLLSEAVTDSEAMEKLRMIRRAQRMANKEMADGR